MMASRLLIIQIQLGRTSVQLVVAPVMKRDLNRVADGWWMHEDTAHDGDILVMTVTN